MNNPARAWWQSPQAFLYAWNLADDAARFLTLRRRILETSAFLDHRIAVDRSLLNDVPAAELAGEKIEGTVPDPAFVFHTAFCGSTLLARSLDVPGRSLVLREPGALLQLADLKRGLTPARRTAAMLLPLTVDLLARPFDIGERVVMKPTNLANNLAADILELRPQARALVLYEELEPFLLSVLKRPRESEAGIHQFLTRFLADAETRGENVPAVAGLTLPKQAALAWTLQMRSLAVWFKSVKPGRARILAAAELFMTPAAALAATASWLGVDLDEREAAAIVASPLWQRHAKNPTVAFSPMRRTEDQKYARRILAPVLREGVDFAHERLRFEGIAFPASFRLLS